PEDIRRITRDALYEFYRRSLRPESLLATTAGPVPLDEVERELGALLGGVLISAEAAATRAEMTPAFRSVSSYLAADMEQVHYYEALQLEPPFAMKDYLALAALNGALGEASSSRLFQSLRERLGLCYSVYSAFSLDASECLWMASANVSTKQLPRLAAELARELDAVASNGLEPQECRDSVSRLAGSFEISLDDPDFRMRRIARQILFAGRALDIEETRARIQAVSLDEVNAMCARLLSGRDRARFAYGRRSGPAARALGLEEVGGE
ncbi:MAG TPA: insulinase family protein, partial [Rectinemataceae bacterium]|nr:insulinase family protein [Rectinemataceae bacterium]